MENKDIVLKDVFLDYQPFLRGISNEVSGRLISLLLVDILPGKK